MGFFEKIIHKLDGQYENVEYTTNIIKEIKRHIKSVLNTNSSDCLVMTGAEFFSMNDMSLDSIEVCRYIGDSVLRLIAAYENRIEVLSMVYDDSETPWKLIFVLRCRLKSDIFSEFSIGVEFTNNRYCEIV